MEAVYSSLASRCLQKHNEGNPLKGAHRTLIALAGPPGSGKSTIAAAVVERLNAEYGTPVALVLPMDGFHLPRTILDRMPNRLEAYARRGAAWTFDAQGVVDIVRQLHRSKIAMANVIRAPGFDHVLKDPYNDAILIGPEILFVIIEGNWVLLEEDPWREISTLVDDTWFVDVELGLASQRVAKRHIASGIEATWEDAVKRVEGNDLVNGAEIRKRRMTPNIVVQSVESLLCPVV